MTHEARMLYSSLLGFLATPSSLSQTLEGHFELKQRPARTLNLLLWMASKSTEIQLQGQCQVCHARRMSARTPSRQLTQTPILCF